MSRESAIKKSVLQFAVASAVVLLVVAREEVAGALSPRTLGIVGILLWVGGFAFLVLRFRAINRKYKSTEQPVLEPGDPTARKKIVRSIRSLKLGLIMMPVALVIGLLATIGEPILPRITGAVMNLLITWTLYKAIRAQKSKLQQLGNTGMQAMSSPQNTRSS
jgi:uncharacterized membrane protein